MEKPVCNRCGKVIVGKIKIITSRKSGKSKSKNVTKMYDEQCFKIKNKEKAINEHNKQKRTCQGKC